MTTSGRTTTAADDYLRRLRSALADLPPGEVEDIVGDVEVQLAESEDELARLGSPESYAAELRVAAGYPPLVPAAASSDRLWGPRSGLWLLGVSAVGALLVGFYGYGAGSGTGLGLTTALLVAVPAMVGWLLVRGHGGLRALPEAVRASSAVRRIIEAVPQGVRELVGSLRPAWWVVRAGLAALLLVSVLSVSGDVQTVVVLTVLFVLPSAWLARLARQSRGWAWVSLPLNAFAVGVGLGVALGGGPLLGYSYGGGYGFAEPTPSSVVTDFAGLPAYNVYPFDAEGKPLTGVYLFDQDGQPIRLYANPCYDGSYEITSGQDAGSYSYPLPNVVNDPRTGRCVELPGVPFRVFLPQTTPTTATPTTAPTSQAPSPSSGVGSAPTSTAPTSTAPTSTAPTSTAPAPPTTG